MPAKKNRLPRIDREEIVKVHEDENSHLWAVSYSDFLMALMSFFILFYSADSSTRKTLILNLSKQFAADGKGGSESLEVGNARLPSNFISTFKDLNIEVAEDNESLIVNFSDNFFTPGQHTITSNERSQIVSFLEKLKPFEDKINLYFEGHADSEPVRMHKTEVIIDNFVLSSLRASSALIIAKAVGFSEKHLYIQAASSNIRNSRTLSIRIEPRKEIL